MIFVSNKWTTTLTEEYAIKFNKTGTLAGDVAGYTNAIHFIKYFFALNISYKNFVWMSDKRLLREPLTF